MVNTTHLSAGPNGARDLIRECQEMLDGRRTAFTSLHDYKAQRLAYWQARAQDLASRTADNERAA